MRAPALPTLPIDLHVEGHPEWSLGHFVMMPAVRALRLGLQKGDHWHGRHVLTYDESELRALEQQHATDGD